MRTVPVSIHLRLSVLTGTCDKSATQTETESSSRVPDHDEDWEVVAKQEVDGRSAAPDSSSSMHFDVTLGWGRWKHTLFSFDYTQSSEYAGDDDDRTGGTGDSAQNET